MVCQDIFLHLLKMLESRKAQKLSFPTVPFGLVASTYALFLATFLKTAVYGH